MGPVIVIPAYEPQAVLISLVQALINDGCSVIVVNDGSSLDCQPIFARLKALPNVVVLSHGDNQGKGAALKTGFRYFLENFAAVSPGVVTADADGQHLVPDIRHIAQSLAANPTHLYLGVRRLKHNKKLPLLNRLGNLFTRNIFEYLLGKTISDTQTGLRGIPARYLLTLLGVPASGFDFELDVLVEATNRQWPIDEVRIQTVYEKQARLLDVLKDNIKIFVVFIRFSAVALCSAGLDYGLFSLTYFYTQNILTSTITARVCSSIFNFTGSRLITFRSKGNVVHEAVKYFSLVGLFMVLSYTVVSSITHLLGISAYISKLLGEGLLFFASFAIQHFLIFNTKKDSSQN